MTKLIPVAATVFFVWIALLSRQPHEEVGYPISSVEQLNKMAAKKPKREPVMTAAQSVQAVEIWEAKNGCGQ